MTPSPRADFDWQSTSDGGATWDSAPPTAYGHIDFQGLTSMHTYGFRVRFNDLKGAHAWSATVSYLVQ